MKYSADERAAVRAATRAAALAHLGLPPGVPPDDDYATLFVALAEHVAAVRLTGADDDLADVLADVKQFVKDNTSAILALAFDQTTVGNA